MLAVIAYDGGDAEAVAIANDSSYGLCGSVYTNDPRAWPAVRPAPGADRDVHAQQRRRASRPLRWVQGVGHGTRVRPQKLSCSWRRSPSKPAGGVQPLGVSDAPGAAWPPGGTECSWSRGLGAPVRASAGSAQADPAAARRGPVPGLDPVAAWRGSGWAVGGDRRAAACAAEALGHTRRGPAVTREVCALGGWP